MVKKTYKEKLLDPLWQKKRLQVLERDNWVCQYCGEKEKTLNIHHFCYNPNGNPWDVEDHALITLCCDCHEVAEYSKKMSPFERELFEQSFWLAHFYNRDAFQRLNRLVLEEKHSKHG